MSIGEASETFGRCRRSLSSCRWPIVVVALLAAVGCGGGHAHVRLVRTSAPALHAAASVAARFDGIPQSGDALGSPRAPYTLFEFIDLQCPFCARFDRDVLPAVIQQFVRPGRLRIEIHPIVFIGPQSANAGAAALAAGLQGRMWQFTDLFYRNQRVENSGYVTPQFIDGIAFSVPGLDVVAMRRASATRAVIAQLTRNNALAHAAAITGTPDFRLGRTGQVLLPFIPGVRTRQVFIGRLDAALGAR